MNHSFNENELTLLDEHSYCVHLLNIRILIPRHRGFQTKSEIKIHLAERNVACSHWKQARSIDARDNYRLLRNRANTTIRNAKVNHPIRNWKLWNLGFVGKHDPVLPDFNCDEFAEHISESGNANPSSTGNNNNSIHNDTRRDRLSFTCVTISDIADSIKGGVASDRVPFVYPTLTYFLTTFLTLLSVIKPVNKKSNGFGLNDFRTISILPALSNSFKNVIKKQIFLDANNFLSLYQSGFQVLLKITDDFLRAIDDHKAVQY